MTIRTYIKRHPEVKEFWLMADENKRTNTPETFTLCRSDNFDHMNWFGGWKIKSVEEAPEPGELITLHV